MEKIKAFFKNKITQIVSWSLLGISTGGLIIGGATLEDVDSGVVLVAGIISAVSALVTFITKKVSGK